MDIFVPILSLALQAAIAHSIPFVYIEQAMAEQDITNAFDRFLKDFNPKKFLSSKVKEDNLVQKQLNAGQPVLTPFEKHLLLEHINQFICNQKCRKLLDLEKSLLQYIQLITETNYPSLKSLSYLDSNWLKIFLKWAYPQINSKKISWLNIEQL